MPQFGWDKATTWDKRRVGCKIEALKIYRDNKASVSRPKYNKCSIASMHPKEKQLFKTKPY